jgi:hypothetical protein
MTRIARAWGALGYEQRLASLAALALLVTMFLPWYDLQSLDRKSGAIDSHSISAFGDVSFVEAAVFLVAAGVIALMFARAERRDFHMPGSDGAVVMAAGAWAALLIFYRVFSRPDGHGYPVGIEWGFFLAFVAAGALGYAGWRMRATNVPEAPLLRPRGSRRAMRDDELRGSTRRTHGEEDVTVVVPSASGPERSRPVPAHPERPPHEISPVRTPSPRTPTGTPKSSPSPTRKLEQKRSRYPPAPSDQLSFEDPAYHSPDDAP